MHRRRRINRAPGFLTGGQTHAASVIFDAKASAPQVGDGWRIIANQSVLARLAPHRADVDEHEAFAKKQAPA